MSASRAEADLNKLSDKELMAFEKEDIKDDPFRLLDEGYLRIKTEDAKLIELHLNEPQRLFFEIAKKRYDEKKPVRIWLLKGRQEGMSTGIEAWLYALTSQADNINTLIMADEKEHSNNLFEMSKLYHEQLDKHYPHLAPKLKKSNEKKLEFEGMHSQIIIATAENLEAAISHTFHLVHLSEVAYFRDMATLMNNLNQGVPDLPGTIIIGETTANGCNMFYREFKRAIKGKSDWIGIFIPWFVAKKYSKPLEDGKLYPIEDIPWNDEYTHDKFIESERELRNKHKLSNEQLNWRRWAIQNKLQEDVDKGLHPISLFKQYYPSNWEEAFLMSGNSFFDRSGLEIQKVKIKKPSRVGELFQLNQQYEFRDLPHGRIKLYELPSKSEQYLVTGDASEAIGQDEASLFVGNKRTNRTVAVVNGQYRPEELAHMAVLLGNYYHNAEIAVENKGYGTAVNSSVFKNYGNIYSMPHVKADGDKNIGFNTNLVTRPEMLAYMAEEIRVNATDLIDEDLYDQCMAFIVNPKSKKAEAAEGEEDGLVICRAIFSKIRREKPFKIQSTNSVSRQRQQVAEINKGRKLGYG